jgi:hypothetical protein
MKLTRKGMNARFSNKSVPLVKRWHYSQRLAKWLNGLSPSELEELKPLKDKMANYFLFLDQRGINENNVFELSHHSKITRSKEILTLIVLLPFAILGLIHCGLPYFAVKKYVENSFKRRVFWGSVKLLLGMISMGILNFPVIFLFHYFVYPSYWLGFLYYSLIGLFGLSTYMWWRNFKLLKEKNMAVRSDLTDLVSKREALLKEIHESVPVA